MHEVRGNRRDIGEMHQENVGAGGTTLAEAAYDSEAYDHNLHSKASNM
jgi:hypothetical protein